MTYTGERMAKAGIDAVYFRRKGKILIHVKKTGEIHESGFKLSKFYRFLRKGYFKRNKQ